MARAAIDIRPWRGNRTDIPLRGRALVLPGSGYTVDHPVLFWTCQVLASAGWQVTAVDWHVDDSVAQDPRPFVESAVHRLDQGAETAERTLVVGKSFGSYAARWASESGYPGVWLTPVLTADDVAAALTTYAQPALLVGGTQDPLWVSHARMPQARMCSSSKVPTTRCTSGTTGVRLCGPWSHVWPRSRPSRRA